MLQIRHGAIILLSFENILYIFRQNVQYDESLQPYLHTQMAYTSAAIFRNTYKCLRNWS